MFRVEHASHEHAAALATGAWSIEDLEAVG
jgi:hypothetical protein